MRLVYTTAFCRFTLCWAARRPIGDRDGKIAHAALAASIGLAWPRRCRRRRAGGDLSAHEITTIDVLEWWSRSMPSVCTEAALVEADMTVVKCGAVAGATKDEEAVTEPSGQEEEACRSRAMM